MRKIVSFLTAALFAVSILLVPVVEANAKTNRHSYKHSHKHNKKHHKKHHRSVHHRTA